VAFLEAGSELSPDQKRHPALDVTFRRRCPFFSADSPVNSDPNYATADEGRKLSLAE